MNASRPLVAIVFGGQSSEHEISCLTAGGVARAIDTQRFDVVGIGIAKSGVWHRYELADIAALRTAGNTLPSLDEQAPVAVMLRSGQGAVFATLAGSQLVDKVKVDVVLSLLHGPYGEDGTIQGMLEMLGLAYVGSGVAASAISMDKQFMKQALVAAGLVIGPYQTISDRQWRSDPQAVMQRIVDALEFPLFVKPARGGSSIGISRVTDAQGLRPAIEQARSFDLKVVVEQGFNNMREVECAVLGGLNGGEPRTSHPGEIIVRTAEHFYDFETKYLPHQQVELKIPADLDEHLERRIRDVAVRAFRAVGAEGLSRVDTFVTNTPLGEPGDVVVNEINTMPGFTSLSMFPSLWQATGMAYPDLITDLIEQALARPLNVNR